MLKEHKVLMGIGGIGCVSYILYLHSKINKLSGMINIAVDNLSSDIKVDISDSMIDDAVQRAVDREVKYIAGRIRSDVNAEINVKVRDSVNIHSSDIKSSASREIERQIKNIDISDMEREIVNKAKEAVAEKFDRKLDGILDEFNDNLNNIQKIYSSIAKSISRE